MIRFLPDTLRDFILRPVAMLASDAGIYIEIMAPDFRPVIALLLVSIILMARFLVGKRHAFNKPSLLLLSIWCFIAFIPWLLTTGNGRYFIPVLLLLGPVCIGCISALKTTNNFKIVLAVLMLFVQGFVVYQSSPWQSWGLAMWKDSPYFQVNLDEDEKNIPNTYVSLANISFSLIAPQFHSESHWVNLASVPVGDPKNMDFQRAQNLIKTADPNRLYLIVPSIPQYTRDNNLPDDELKRVIDTQLKPYGLILEAEKICKFIQSGGLRSMANRKETIKNENLEKRLGFWVCHIQYSPEVITSKIIARSERLLKALILVEQKCQRFFSSIQNSTSDIPGGLLRIYPASEMKIYAYEDSGVYYKYYRAFNPVKVGSVEDILRGIIKLDCSQIKGRSGLPWEREI